MDPIEHVVLLMLENHSFDQMLGCMQELYPRLDGISSKAARRANKDAAGRAYEQTPTQTRQVQPDPKHEHINALNQIAGGNQGFITDYLGFYGEKAARDVCPQIMAYYERGYLPGLHPLAEQFTVCDHWFASLPGPTWPNRFFALSGTSNGRVLMPEGIRQLDMLWTQTQDTIFDRLSERNRTWRVYFYDFPASLILRRQRRPSNLQHYRRMDHFFVDARADQSKFPDFVFIEPKYFGVDQNDDHPPHNVMKAQKLIADVYNAIRSNDGLWASTLLVVVYDEHGGFYDHVEPPAAVAPDDHREEYAFDRLGVRVPAVLISPWLPAGVAATRFDHTSVLKYLIEKWGLGPLGARTEWTNSISAALGFLEQRRTDTIPFIRVSNSKLVPDEPDWEKKDVSAHRDGLHLVADILEAEDEALANAVAVAARVAETFEQGLPRARAAIGDRLIAWGRALRGPLEDLQQQRVNTTQAIVRRLIPED
jgi:phospholipase C